MSNDAETEVAIIPRKEYERLMMVDEIMGCLEAIGVRSWEGYSTAMDIYYDNI